MLQNDLTAGTRMLRESKQLADDLGDTIDARWYKVPEAFAAMHRHDFSSAIALLDNISTPSKDWDWGITAKILLSFSYWMQGDDGQAMAQWQTSWTCARNTPNGGAVPTRCGAWALSIGAKATCPVLESSN
ncbi:hypothetical protein [Saccharopolyspora hattusasensis]|uniref:hypothetical protein n=1 Tax=Saccharopolyspora hattusasensis TaxID=1128679 RepID=UPI003D9534B8